MIKRCVALVAFLRSSRPVSVGSCDGNIHKKKRVYRTKSHFSLFPSQRNVNDFNEFRKERYESIHAHTHSRREQKHKQKRDFLFLFFIPLSHGGDTL